MTGLEAVQFLHKVYQAIENMSNEDLLEIAEKEKSVISIGSPIVTFSPEIVYCRDCIHRPFKKYSEIMAPKIAEGYIDYTCPFVCPDPYYTQIPEDDFYCKAGETHE